MNRAGTTGWCRPQSEADLDVMARDVFRITQILRAWQVTQVEPRPVSLDVCAACGALERADRACQVCKARRRAAS